MNGHKKGTVASRINLEKKNVAERILAELGLTPSSAIDMFYSSIIINRGLPFDVRLPQKTMESIMNTEMGIDLEQVESVSSFFGEIAIGESKGSSTKTVPKGRKKT